MKPCFLISTVLILLARNADAAAPTTRYVDANSVSPSSPYTNWATAASTIQDAVNVAGGSDEIVVTNGLYETGGAQLGATTNRVRIFSPLFVHSVNGPEVTIIRGF